MKKTLVSPVQELDRRLLRTMAAALAAMFVVLAVVIFLTGSEESGKKIEISGTGFDHLALEAVNLEDGSVVTVFECRPGGPNGSECSQGFWEPLPVGTYRYQFRVAMREENGSVGLEVVCPVEGLTTTFVPWW